MSDSDHADRLRYWDSCAFLAIFNDEEEREDCEGVIAACRDGKTRIVTSALTLAEVVKIKGGTALPTAKSAEITAFFELSYIVVRSVTRRTAELARELIWTHDLAHKDAIHVATALIANVSLLETKDQGLRNKSTLIIPNYDPLYIELPWWNAPMLPGSQPPTEIQTP